MDKNLFDVPKAVAKLLRTTRKTPLKFMVDAVLPLLTASGIRAP
jgi:hypothetical protein